MTSEPSKLLNCFELLAVISVCGLLFIVAHREVGLALWSIPAMTLFAAAGLTLLSVLLFAGAPNPFEAFRRHASQRREMSELGRTSNLAPLGWSFL